jgi:hypothetical protein
MSSTTTRPPIQPLRLSLLQHRMDSSSSATASPPESPQPLSPLSPRHFNRPETSALGIIVPPGTPPVDALPRWLVDKRLSKQKSLLSGARTPTRGIHPYSPFESTFRLASPAIGSWQDGHQPLVRTPDAFFEGQEPTPYGSSRDGFPFDIGVISGERIPTPVEPRLRPRPLPRCSSDDIADRRLFRVNAWGEHNSPNDAASGLFGLMQSPNQGEARSRPRHLPLPQLASTAPSRVPSPCAE